MNEQINTEQQKEVTGKTVISFKEPTPMWANWVFRIVFFLTLAIALIIAGDASIPDADKAKYMLWMKAFDIVVWGIGRGLGVKKESFEQDQG